MVPLIINPKGTSIFPMNMRQILWENTTVQKKSPVGHFSSLGGRNERDAPVWDFWSYILGCPPLPVTVANEGL